MVLKSRLLTHRPRMRKLQLILYCSLVIVQQGCNVLTGQGFLFRGVYSAEKSGYRIELISKGYVKFGHDLSESSRAIIQICPLKKDHGRTFRIALTAKPNEGIQMESQNLSFRGREWNWQTSEQLLRDELETAGYGDLDMVELKGSVEVIENSLSGPKGVVLKGQIQSVMVIRADIEYGSQVIKGQPPNKWIEPTELPLCDSP